MSRTISAFVCFRYRPLISTVPGHDECRIQYNGASSLAVLIYTVTTPPRMIKARETQLIEPAVPRLSQGCLKAVPRLRGEHELMNRDVHPASLLLLLQNYEIIFVSEAVGMGIIGGGNSTTPLIMAPINLLNPLSCCRPCEFFTIRTIF